MIVNILVHYQPNIYIYTILNINIFPINQKINKFIIYCLLPMRTSRVLRAYHFAKPNSKGFGGFNKNHHNRRSGKDPLDRSDQFLETLKATTPQIALQ